MGQYHYVCNLDKHEYLHPHSMGDGLKLLEFGDSSGGTMAGLAILLAASNGRGGGDLHSDHPIIGSWAGDRIAIIGDYNEPADVPGFTDRGDTPWDESIPWQEISEHVKTAMLADSYLAQRFNHA